MENLISTLEAKVRLLYVDSVIKSVSLFAKECHRLLSRLYSFSFPEVSKASGHLHQCSFSMICFCVSDEEALKLIEKDSSKSGSRKKSSSTWQERDMGSILHVDHNTIVVRLLSNNHNMHSRRLNDEPWSICNTRERNSIGLVKPRKGMFQTLS